MVCDDSVMDACYLQIHQIVYIKYTQLLNVICHNKMVKKIKQENPEHWKKYSKAEV